MKDEAAPAATMTEVPAMRWLRLAEELLRRFEREQGANVEAASELCAKAIGGGGLVHMFGNGHSRIPVEEMFPRYGSYPGFNPMVELSTSFHTQVAGSNGQRQAMFIERVPGLAASILANFELGPPDAMIIFSASGRSNATVEMAVAARGLGLGVIAVTSLPEALSQPPDHESGSRMHDHADVVIDLGSPPGDALVPIEGWSEPVGPASTILNIAAVNCIKCRTAELLAAAGVELPVITAASVAGRERSRMLFEAAYEEHARRAAEILRGSPPRHSDG